MIKWFQRLIEKPLEENTFDQTVMHNLPVMEEESDPEDLTLENAYRTRWIWYHTILAILIFFTNMLLFGIFILLAVKL
tara:strand:+ start:1504 stop:1737 length:234 start_codon:yes stop_codon:yes gene_type:complete